jgi:phosphoglycolate phosphatase
MMREERPLATLVFDLDGTLVHSAPDIHAAASVMLAEMGRPELDLATITGFIGNGIEKLAERALRATGGVPAEGIGPGLAILRRAYDADLVGRTRPFDGVTEALGHLRAAGHRLAICTNKPEAPARELCAALGLDSYFDAIVGGDTLSVKKPDPAPLLHAIAAVGGTPGDTVYVGDSGVDHDTAKAAGIRFVLYEGGYLNAVPENFAPALQFADWADLPALVA